MDLEDYNLEMESTIAKIKESKSKTVLLQFPDGMKPQATEIAAKIEKETGKEIRIWLGSCFGACDIPNSESDLLVQFGHAPWD